MFNRVRRRNDRKRWQAVGLGSPCRIFAGYLVSRRRPHARHPAKSALRAEKTQNFALFFRRRRNFGSLSSRETSLVNRDLSIKWDFDFKSDRLLERHARVLLAKLGIGHEQRAASIF